MYQSSYFALQSRKLEWDHKEKYPKTRTQDFNRPVNPNPAKLLGWRIQVCIWPTKKLRVKFVDGSGIELNGLSGPNQDN
jgi:hypothetical protein